MHLRADRLHLSPSDVTAFLACEHLTTLSLRAARGEIASPTTTNEQAELIFRKGLEHEQAYLEQLRADGKTDRRDPRARRPRLRGRSARDGRRDPSRSVDVDLPGRPRRRRLARVRRLPRAAAATAPYEAVDTKLARHGEAGRRAAAHASTRTSSSASRGALPERMHVVLGTRERESFRPRRLRRLLPPRPRRAWSSSSPRSRRRTRGRSITARSAPSSPVCNARWDARRPPDARREHPPRPDRAARARGDHDARGARRRAAGTPRSRSMAPRTFETLRHQAALQLGHRRTGDAPLRAARARAASAASACCRQPSAGDLFYDIEGDPFLEPGARARVPAPGSWTRTARFTAIWAHDREEERRALERLIGLFHERLAADTRACTSTTTRPTRLTALKRLAAQHGDARGGARRAAPPRGLRRPLHGHAPGAAHLVPAATRSRRCASSSWTRRGRARGRRRRDRRLRALARDARRRAARGDRALQRGGLPLDPAAPRLARRAEGGGGGAVRRRDPVARAARAASADRGGGGRAERARRGRASALLATGDPDAASSSADLLEYHRREARPGVVVVLRALRDDARAARRGLGVDRPARAGRVAQPVGGRRSRVDHGFRFPVQQHKLDAGDGVFDPVTGGGAGDDRGDRRRRGDAALRRGPKLEDVPLPTGAHPRRARGQTKEQQAALMRLGGSLQRATAATRTSSGCCGASRRSAAPACSARRSRRWGGSSARSRARTSSSRARPARARRGRARG